jgi:superfamily II DNA or RNA helicase
VKARLATVLPPHPIELSSTWRRQADPWRPPPSVTAKPLQIKAILGGTDLAKRPAVQPTPRLAFDRGTLVLRGPLPPRLELPGFLWDERSRCLRAPAFRYRDVLVAAAALGLPLADDVSPRFRRPTGPWTAPPLRGYQDDAILAFHALARRGLVALPTGAGKTRVAIAALARARTTALVLCPTRALLWGWRREIERWYGGAIGMVGDGEGRVEDVTLMTFESAYRHLDRLGDRFAFVVVDEVHHFAGGIRAEALEMCPAPLRLGLSATLPARETAGYERLALLLGPIACEVGMEELAGRYLAPADVVRLGVRLSPDERAEYERSYRPFAALRAAFFRGNPGADWVSCLRAMARTAEGRAAIAGYRRAVAIASFPAAKRRLVEELLARHAGDKTLVFTASADDAYEVSAANLIPAIVADIDRDEREDVLRRFRDGRVRALVSARVLNEGIDVPDARIAIVVGGALGSREHRQRIGRVLRPGPDKRAIVYELVTCDTLDDARARGRRIAAFEPVERASDAP